MKFKNKIVSTLLLAVTVIASVVPVSADDSELSTFAISNNLIAPANFNGSFRDIISDSSRELYDCMLDDFSTYGTHEVTFTYGASKPSKSQADSDADDAIMALWLDHPELFWLESTCHNSYVMDGVKVKEITISVPTYYSESPAQLLKMKREIEGNLNEIKDNIDMSRVKTDVDKVVYIHDYLTSTLAYNRAALSAETGSMPNAFNAYGALKNNPDKVVCQSYAKAFQMLCKKFGMNCIMVIGTVNGTNYGNAHSWNYVKLNGEWCFVDVTADDIYSEKINPYSYKYFLRPAPTTYNEDIIWENINLANNFKIKYGDADSNGYLSASDASFILQLTLDNSFENSMTYSGVVACEVTDGKAITSEDASTVFQAVNDETYKLPIYSAFSSWN